MGLAVFRIIVIYFTRIGASFEYPGDPVESPLKKTSCILGRVSDRIRTITAEKETRHEANENSE